MTVPIDTKSIEYLVKADAVVNGYSLVIPSTLLALVAERDAMQAHLEELGKRIEALIGYKDDYRAAFEETCEQLATAHDDALEKAASCVHFALDMDTTGHKFKSEVLDDRLEYLESLPKMIRDLKTKDTP